MRKCSISSGRDVADSIWPNMNPFYNLPPEQQRAQRLVDQFNKDEQLWTKLEPRRRLRRKLRPGLSRKKRIEQDLEEFARERPPIECVGEPIQTTNLQMVD